MDKNIVLGSVSLSAAFVVDTSQVNNDILQSVSLRSAQIVEPTTVSRETLNYSSMAIAGYLHAEGEWEEPKNIDYVVIHI